MTNSKRPSLYNALELINSRPKPFEFYTAEELWTNEHTSRQMLDFHLNGDIDLSSRNTKFIDRSVKWICSQFKINKNSSIIDIGCGPGLYASRFAKKKASVTGVDFSSRSIAYAQDAATLKGHSINYIHQNYLDFTSDAKFDLITMIMCDFCALSPSQRQQLLKNFHTMLNPGGAVLLDVYSLHEFEGKHEYATCEVNLLNGFWSAEKYYGFLNTFKYEDEKVMLDKYTIVEENRIWQVFNWLQYFSPSTLEPEFTAENLSITDVFSDLTGAPYKPESSEFVVVAVKD